VLLSILGLTVFIWHQVDLVKQVSYSSKKQSKQTNKQKKNKNQKQQKKNNVFRRS
jgi:hypothetical protein